MIDWNMASACAAWVGAITGIGNSIFSFIKYLKTKPRPKITLSDQYSSYLLPANYISDGKDKFTNDLNVATVSFRIANLGNSALMIDHIRIYEFGKETWINYNPVIQYDYKGMNIQKKGSNHLSFLRLKLAPIPKFPMKIETSSAIDFQYVGIAKECLSKRNKIKLRIYFANKKKSSSLKIPSFEDFLDSHDYKLL